MFTSGMWGYKLGSRFLNFIWKINCVICICTSSLQLFSHHVSVSDGVGRKVHSHSTYGSGSSLVFSLLCAGLSWGAGLKSILLRGAMFVGECLIFRPYRVGNIPRNKF